MFGFRAKGGSENISVLLGLQLSGCAGPERVKVKTTVWVAFEQDFNVELTVIEPPSATVDGDRPMET